MNPVMLNGNSGALLKGKGELRSELQPHHARAEQSLGKVIHPYES